MMIDRPRRQLLGAAALAATGASVLDQSAAAAPTPSERPPHDVGRKFNADGRVRSFLGNTIICPLPQQDAGFETFDAVLDVYRDLPAHGFARKLSALPPSSYHMTIFGGANDQDRKPGLWPADIARDTPMAVCDALLAERLMRFDLDCDLPFRMVVNDAEPAAHPDPILIDLSPADAAEALKLSRLRDRLSSALGIRQPDHDRYRFHISIAYQIDWFSDQEQAEHVAARRRWRTELKRKAPVLEFGAPQYCTFADMFAFRQRLMIS